MLMRIDLNGGYLERISDVPELYNINYLMPGYGVNVLRADRGYIIDCISYIRHEAEGGISYWQGFYNCISSGGRVAKCKSGAVFSTCGGYEDPEGACELWQRGFDRYITADECMQNINYYKLFEQDVYAMSNFLGLAEPPPPKPPYVFPPPPPPPPSPVPTTLTIVATDESGRVIASGPEPLTIVIRGKLTESGTGAGVGNAPVSVFENGTKIATAYTQPDGAFAVKVVRGRGTYVYYAEYAGNDKYLGC